MTTDMHVANALKQKTSGILMYKPFDHRTSQNSVSEALSVAKHMRLHETFPSGSFALFQMRVFVRFEQDKVQRFPF